MVQKKIVSRITGQLPDHRYGSSSTRYPPRSTRTYTYSVGRAGTRHVRKWGSSTVTCRESESYPCSHHVRRESCRDVGLEPGELTYRNIRGHGSQTRLPFMSETIQGTVTRYTSPSWSAPGLVLGDFVSARPRRQRTSILTMTDPSVLRYRRFNGDKQFPT